jgi:integrase
MVNEMECSKIDWDVERWTIPAAKMKTGWDHVVPLSRQALAILRSVQKLTGHHRRYAFSCSKDAPLSNNTLNKRLRLLGIDTKTDHCAHGFRTTFPNHVSPRRDQGRQGMGWRCRRAAARASQ